MSKKDKPLPQPPRSPFGRKRFSEARGQEEPLMSERIAMAMAEGKLNEFLNSEFPDNDNARKMAGIMMGMTGISPVKDTSSEKGADTKKDSGMDLSEKPPPEGLVAAAQSGDVKVLIEMLQKERQKRAKGVLKNRNEAESSFNEKDYPIEKEIIDMTMKIASDNKVAPEWLISRALRLYIQEYQKSGRL